MGSGKSEVTGGIEVSLLSLIWNNPTSLVMLDIEIAS